MPDLSRASLRQTLRQARNALTQQQQQDAGDAIASMLGDLPQVAQATTLAMYLPNDGEVDLRPFSVKYLHDEASGRLALPVLHPVCKGHLLFMHYDAATPMQSNRFGIDEPAIDCTRVIPTAELDVILMPLVGFDGDGNRLGMGGGFYDRTLANRHRWANRPTLIGIAHDCQQVAQLPVASWDVPLDAIVTPSKVILAQ